MAKVALRKLIPFIAAAAEQEKSPSRLFIYLRQAA